VRPGLAGSGDRNYGRSLNLDASKPADILEADFLETLLADLDALTASAQSTLLIDCGYSQPAVRRTTNLHEGAN
jgi:hypothetical protein